MRMCQPHWDQMREALDQRGLTPLVCGSGEEAMEVMKDQLEGQPTRWDPLLAMNFNFMTAALNHGGLAVMGVDEHGEQYCPLCLAKKLGEVEDMDQVWIYDCADEMQRHAIDKGMIPGTQ